MGTGNSSQSLLSVVTPVYNGAAYIVRSYISLLAQRWTDWEWVVVDDGSTDDTLALLKTIAAQDPRVIVETSTTNRGRQYARERALALVSGGWVVVWDIDDLHFPDRLERIAAARAAGHEFCCSYVALMDDDFTVLGVRGFNSAPFAERVFAHPSLACDADLSRRYGYECGSGIVIGEDLPIIYGLSNRHDGRWIEEALTLYLQDRNVDLTKAILHNRSRLEFFLREFGWGGGARAIRRKVGIYARCKLKLGLLAAMRVFPASYRLTVPLRARGAVSQGWTLSDARRDFVTRIRDVDPTGAPDTWRAAAADIRRAFDGAVRVAA